MKKITFEESRQLMLDILKDVAKFCDENSLTYFLSSGTLIGAIRHKGFIPWDDDIDIEMPREDYNRFIELYRKKGKYTICAPFEPDSIYFYTKIYNNKTLKYESGIDYSRFRPLGVDIDVFPIDGQPDGDHYDSFVAQTNRRVRIYSYFGSSIVSYRGQLKSRAKQFVSRLIGKNYFCKLYIKSASRYLYENSLMVGFISPYSKYKNRHRKSIFTERIKVQFEDGEFWAPKGYDEYLRNIYGDYMQLPPKGEQKTHHANNVYWK